MTSSTTVKGLAALAAGTALVLGSAGTASAQGNVIPGDDYEGRTIIVNQGPSALTITNVNRDTGTVSYSMVNNSGQNMRCEAPSPDERQRSGATVSAAPVIQRTAEFYENFEFSASDGINVAAGVGIGDLQIAVPFWPLLQFLPTGSVAGFLSERQVQQTAIVNGHRDAQVAGLSGLRGAFTVNNGTTHTGTVQLAPQASGERSEDPVGIIVICGPGGTQDNQQLYAWTGYEDGYEPTELPQPEGGLDSVSLGSLDISALTGSLG